MTVNLDAVIEDRPEPARTKMVASRCVRQICATSRRGRPFVHALRGDACRPIPASMSIDPGGAHDVQFPDDPEASTQTSSDIRVTLRAGTTAGAPSWLEIIHGGLGEVQPVS